MAKYIGTYTNSGAVQTALNTNELSRPFVVYTTDNGEVIYGQEGDRAEAGDIVVYVTGDTLLHYIKLADYNTTDYPIAAYVPVGVVAKSQHDNPYSGVEGEIVFLSNNSMSPTNPDTGDKYGRCLWGDDTFLVPGIFSGAAVTDALTDYDGKTNTQTVLNYATGQINWKTDSAITSGSSMFPAFECAWRYHTSGTVQGDWYLPACGEIHDMFQNLTEINSGRTAIGVAAITLSSSIYNRIGTSTQATAANAWCFSTNLNSPIAERKTSTAKYHYAVCSKLMTRI